MLETIGLTVFAIAEGQHADFRPGQKFFHHNMVAGSAELFVQHDFLYAIGGFLLILADQHAFAQRQAIRLDNNRDTCPWLRM